MKIKCRLVEAEQIISEMEERLIDVADDIAETEEDTQLIVSGWWVFLPQLNLQLHEGILCNWDEEEQMFMPDVAVTVVYEADADRTEYIYFEQDGMEKKWDELYEQTNQEGKNTVKQQTVALVSENQYEYGAEAFEAYMEKQGDTVNIETTLIDKKNNVR